MADNQKYNEERVNTLPTEGLSAGDRYYLNVGNNKYKTFIVSDSLELIMSSGDEFIEKDTVVEFRNISEKEIWAIEQGYYKGVKLNGYHIKGDTPRPIEYYISNTTNEDDGGSIISVEGVKFEHLFTDIDVRYFGIHNDTELNQESILQKVINKGLTVIIPSNFTIAILGVVLKDHQVLTGGGNLKSLATNEYTKGMVGCGNFSVVRNINFYGNGTATPTNASAVSSLGVFSINKKGVLIDSCKFYDFIAMGLNSGNNLINVRDSHAITISNNYFDETNLGYSEISAGYTTGDTRIINNTSYGNSDVGITVSIVGVKLIEGTEVPVKVNHIITGNIFIKLRYGTPAEGQPSLGRHCIHVQYTGQHSRAIISNNILGNCSRHGLYLRGDDVADTNLSRVGNNIITSNIFKYCGRGEGSTYSSGIRVESNLPTTISNNWIYKSGFNPDGTLGTQPGYGIECVRGVRNCVISNNVIEDSKTGGIFLRTTVQGKQMSNVLVQGNVITGDCHGIAIFRQVAENSLYQVRIDSNMIRLGEGDYTGIFTEIVNPTTILPLERFPIAIHNNHVSGVNKKGRGITFDQGYLTLGVDICNNVVKNLDSGISSYRSATNQPLYVNSRNSLDFNIKGNIVGYCIYGIRFTSGVNTNTNVIDKSNIINDCTFPGIVFNVASSTERYNACFSGEILKLSTTLKGVRIDADAIPTVGAWVTGDEIINTNKGSGQPYGWRCVVSGSPGTWELITKFPQAAASPNTASIAAGEVPTKAEFDALLAELRDLKTKLRTAVILAT